MGATVDDTSVKEWLRTWGEYVASADFDNAAPLFDPSVVGFGTRATEAVGLERLAADQWGHIWPTLHRFAFDVDAAHLWIADDRLQAVIATTWTSEGPRPDGTVGPRDGRATVVLRRAAVDEPWLGVHTHFSLSPAADG